MVSPGTGVAPFRAFLEEREARGARNRNWLFFGNQKHDCDFLYRDELEGWQRSSLLTRLELAFSRDQAHKVYVQHRMRENAAGLWRWVEGGAYFYVCGDAQHVAKDVDDTLKAVVAQHGAMSATDAEQFVKKLAKTGRYARDVY